jgi:hypothetical protein
MGTNESLTVDRLGPNKIQQRNLKEEKECVWLESMESVKVLIRCFQNEYQFLSSRQGPISTISSDEDN